MILSSDYKTIDPRYGTLEDWDHLLKGIHERGMKLMMDLVMNHTSDEVRINVLSAPEVYSNMRVA